MKPTKAITHGHTQPNPRKIRRKSWLGVQLWSFLASFFLSWVGLVLGCEIRWFYLLVIFICFLSQQNWVDRKRPTDLPGTGAILVPWLICLLEDWYVWFALLLTSEREFSGFVGSPSNRDPVRCRWYHASTHDRDGLGKSRSGATARVNTDQRTHVDNSLSLIHI